MATIRVPDILGAVSELQWSVHPAEEEVTKASEEWFAMYNLISPVKWDEFVGEKFGLATAMAYPLGDKKSLRIAMDWFIILFKFDDLLDEASSTLMRDEGGATEASKIFISAMTDIENFQPVSNLPIATAFHDFMIRLRTASTPSVQKRFVDSIVAYAMAASKQTGLRERHICPRIEEYIALRRETGAVMSCLPFIENSLQIDVPDRVYQHPIIKSLHEIANDIVCWGNDIISFNREQAEGDHFNLVAIVAIEKEIPVQLALDYVFLMFQSAVRRWFEVRARIPKFDPETDYIVSKYVQGLEFLCSGLSRWYFETNRYFGHHRAGVKETMSIRVFPMEPYAAQPFETLRYAVIGF